VTESRGPNPFVGPVPFERKDADLFFGRVGEVQELISLIVANRVVVLYAASGAGKTSLLDAGVLPLLERQERFEVLPTTRFRHLTAAEVRRGIENVYVYTTLLCWNESAEDVPADGSAPEPSKAAPAQAAVVEETLPDFLSRRPMTHDPRGRTLPRVVVFDQFEEIFTIHPEYWEHRELFFNQLAETLDQDRYLRVVLSLREDYVAQLEPLLPLLPSHVRFRLERLDRDGAVEAVVGPVAKAGRTFRPGVAEALVQDLQTLRVDVGGDNPTEAAGEFVEPVQLQVVCHNLWSELPADTDEITRQHVHAFGDVDEVLERFYDESVRAAARTARILEKRLRQWVEEAFITSVGTRSTIYRTAESTAGIPNAVIEDLENRHLIRGEWRAGARWYELTHDRFIGPVQNANARFRAEVSRRRRRRARLTATALALAILAGGVAWIFPSVFPETPPASAAISLQGTSQNVTFASYQQLIEQPPTGSAGERARTGNLLELEVTTQGLSHKLLVLRVATVDADSLRRVFPAKQDVVTLLTPQSQSEQFLQRLWIALPTESGHFGYAISLRTADGVELVGMQSPPFNVNPLGTAVRPNVVLYELRVRKTGRTSGTVISSPAGIDCGSTCVAEYKKGTRVTLLGLAAPTSFFHSWRQGCTGNGACRVEPSKTTAVVAKFTRTLVDIVANTGGIGVRYRNSPKRSDLVPGNGPREDERVTIYCYTRGEAVHENVYWVKIKLAPDRYVPAAYLRDHSKPPAGDVAC
jgi:hypothetical protein